MKCWRGQMEWPDYTPPVRPSKAERFWAKVDIRGETQCWEWQASKLPNGYGQFDHTTAHRVAKSLALSAAIPADKVIDHLCRNVGCVNPSHLDVVTNGVNVERGLTPILMPIQRRAWSQARTHCSHGHELTDENVYSAPSNPTWRVCRTCKAETDRRRRARRRASP